jgi:hypothetical protein
MAAADHELSAILWPYAHQIATLGQIPEGAYKPPGWRPAA